MTPIDSQSRTFIYVQDQQAGYESLANIFGGLAAQTRKYRDGIRLEFALIEGMPFVGWALNAESRRIDGPAQLGEGDFIKYLGRAPEPEEIGPCSFDRE